jgi:signal transduction histidine kinase
MGSRSRSIRLRIYFLVAIPLVALVGLLGYVAGTSVRNAVNLDRAPNLINATSIPTAVFTSYLQAERAAAVTYLFQPTSANLAAYNTAIANTSQHAGAFKSAMTSPATVSSETPGEKTAIGAVLGNLGKLSLVRAAVAARAVTPMVALTDYSQGIAAEPELFLTEANSETDAAAIGQALGLIATVQAREELSQEWALIGGMLAGNRMSRIDRTAITEAAATRQADLNSAQSILTPANLATYDAGQNGSAAEQQSLAAVEQALASGANVGQLPTTGAQWQQTASTLLQDYYNGGVTLAKAELASDHQFSRSAWIRVAVTSGIALLALLLTIVVTTLVARGIIRRLRGLERSALTLAEQQLPDVIARLRRGEDVDVAHEAPPLQTSPGSSPDGTSPGRISRDEIGRVGESFDLVRQTAIRAAVEEASLRRGLNDMFRSLARRSQSLLHRQLALLDQMERRATDPEALDDLFRLDHLTTRMRRHAEGLVILAGAPPGRGWSSPVRMVDVMRGAIAEVEDYARVAVATRAQAALSGSAVADVIHLLAELIENATTLSPPYTSVRVSGDTVANGFAIEVEDRGLGMSPERLDEFNERLTSPPEFNPADSEQLGLFVVSQLARRHSIQVTLKTSPYRGITAVVLIPAHLVVTEETFRAGLAGAPAAIAMAPVATSGTYQAAAELTGPAGSLAPGLTELRALPGLPPAPGIRIAGPLRRSQGMPPELAGPEPAAAAAGSAGSGPAGADQIPDRAGPGPDRGTQPAFDVFMPRHRVQEPTQPPDPGVTDPGVPELGVTELGVTERGTAAGAYLASPGYPGGGSPGYPGGGSGSPLPLPGPGSQPYPDPGLGPVRGSAPYPPATPMTPVATARPALALGPPWELSGRTGPPPVVPGRADPESAAGAPESAADDGLPRRVRQASLAPQLRDDPPPRRVTVASSAPSSRRTPEEIRQTMSALQRGWQEGRAEPAEGPAASSDPDAGHGPVADQEERGNSDAT